MRAAFVDGTALAYRAWHALPTTIRGPDGALTNAALGFAQMFRKLLLMRRPAFGAVVFDAPGPTWRHAMDPTYKDHRPPMPSGLRGQLAAIDAVVAAHGWPVLRQAGVEADDVIATLCGVARRAGHDVLLVSGDKDLSQLIGPGVTQLDPSTEQVFGAEIIEKRWGVPPSRLRDLLALAGDASDGVAGAPGVGRKRAAEWLNRWGDLEGIYASLADLPAPDRRRLERARDAVFHARTLVTLRDDVAVGVTLDALQVPEPDPSRLNAVYRALGFHAFLTVEAPSVVSSPAWFVADTLDVARAALSAETLGTVAVHPLVDGPPRGGTLVGLALSPSPGRAVYFPFRGVGGHLGAEGRALLAPWLANPNAPKVAADLKALRHAVGEVAGVVGDLGIMSWLADPTAAVPHRVEQVVRLWLQRALQPAETRRVDGSWAAAEVARAGPWACHVADAVRATWPKLQSALLDAGLHTRLTTLELPLAGALGELEQRGVAVDPAAIDALGAWFAAGRDAEHARLQSLAGCSFHPGSLRQLQKVMYQHLGLPVVSHTRSGWSTSRETLDKLRPRAPDFIDTLIRWRELARLVDASTDVLRAAIDPVDGRVHPTFQQTVGAAGRIITAQPDLQRTPVRTEELAAVRRVVIAPPGHVLVRGDWSQIELRLLAHLSLEPALVAAFRQGRDLHRATAADLCGIAEADADAGQRALGKKVNFATLYGQGAAALSRDAGIDIDAARAFLAARRKAWPVANAWRERVVADAYASGEARTWMGWRRRIPELASNDPTERSYGERIAVNTTIQGSGADLMKVALLSLAPQIEALGAAIVLTVHDEIVVESPTSEAERVAQAVHRTMSDVATLAVPLVVDIAIGPNWVDGEPWRPPAG